MSQREAIATFLKRASWGLMEIVDLGTTAHVFIIERDGERCALKARRDDDSDLSALQTEYRVLRYLNGTLARQCVPRVGPWLPELDGFLMEPLRYPTPAEEEEDVWMPNLARALQTLHRVDRPMIEGLEDDRPDVGRAVSRRFRELFEVVLRTDDTWAGLSGEDRRKLACVRAHYQAYAADLSTVEDMLAVVGAALTHGDLARDNVMVTQGGRLAIADWGSARITVPWLDAASLATYKNWSLVQRRRFYGLYLGGNATRHREAVQCLELLCRLHRYRSCVRSLVWLNDASQGLDDIGRAYFETQMRSL